MTKGLCLIGRKKRDRFVEAENIIKSIIESLCIMWFGYLEKVWDEKCYGKDKYIYNTAALTGLPVGESKADFIMINIWKKKN